MVVNSSINAMGVNIFGFRKIVEYWVFIAATVFFLGYFMFPTTSKHNTFFYIAVCGPIVMLLPSYYRRFFNTNWIFVSVVVFSMYLFANSLWSIHYSTDQSLKYFRYLITIFCLFGAVFLVQSKELRYSDYLFKGYVIIGCFYYTYGIWEHFSIYQNPFGVRYSDRPIDEALFAGMLLLAAFWLFLGEKNVYIKSLYIGLSIPFVLIMLLAKSRGPQLAFILTLPVLAYYRNVSIKKFYLSLLAMILVLGWIILWSDMAKQIFDRGLTFPYRQEIWMVSLKESLQFFWFGQGASHNPQIYLSNGEHFNHSHNIVLSVFRMGGVVGVLLFVINIGLCFVASFKRKGTIDCLWGVWLFFGLLCLLTNGQYPLTRPTSLWFAYWIPVAFITASSDSFKLDFYKTWQFIKKLKFS